MVAVVGVGGDGEQSFVHLHTIKKTSRASWPIQPEPKCTAGAFGQTAGGTQTELHTLLSQPHLSIIKALWVFSATQTFFLGAWSHCLIINVRKPIYIQDMHILIRRPVVQGLNHVWSMALCYDGAAAVHNLNLLIWNFQWKKLCASIILKWNTFVMSGGQQSNGRKLTALGQSHSGWLHYNESKKLQHWLNSLTSGLRTVLRCHYCAVLRGHEQNKVDI